MLWEWCFLGVENGYLGHFFHLQEMGNGKWEMGRALNIDRAQKYCAKKIVVLRIGADDTKSAFLEPHTAMLRWTWVKPVEKWPNRKSSYVLQLVFLFKNFDCNNVSLGSVVVCDYGYRLSEFESRMSQLIWAEVIFNWKWLVCANFFVFFPYYFKFPPPHFSCYLRIVYCSGA